MKDMRKHLIGYVDAETGEAVLEQWCNGGGPDMRTPADALPTAEDALRSAITRMVALTELPSPAGWPHPPAGFQPQAADRRRGVTPLLKWLFSAYRAPRALAAHPAPHAVVDLTGRTATRDQIPAGRVAVWR